jgi:surface antigen
VRSLRFLFALTAVAAADPGAAQFGSFLRSITPPASSSPAPSTTTTGSSADEVCKTRSRSKGASMVGKMFGNATNRMLGGTGIAQWVPIPEVAGVLSDAVACRLDQKEQRQAATATQTVVREGEIGSSQQWKSDSREGVSGTSTLTARTEERDGTSCVQVTDVIIVEGEETTVPKKMCRGPGASGYTIAAA